MTTDFRALCAELIASWDADGCDWKPQHQARWEATVNRARAALAEPEGREPASVTKQPSDEEIIAFWSDHCAGDGDAGIIRLARWGHQPAPPADGEVAELVAWLREQLHVCLQAPWTPGIKHFGRAADLLEQQATAYAICERERLHQSTRAADLEIERYPVPVPVSERLPGPEDCAPWPQPSDKSGWCWMSRTVHGFYGSFAIWEQVSVVPMCREVYTHWLPAHALPLPEVGE